MGAWNKELNTGKQTGVDSYKTRPEEDITKVAWIGNSLGIDWEWDNSSIVKARDTLRWRGGGISGTPIGGCSKCKQVSGVELEEELEMREGMRLRMRAESPCLEFGRGIGTGET